MPQLTPQERDSLARHLQTTSADFLSAIADLRPSQWRFKPSPEAWSVAECADHVVAVERRIFDLVSRLMQANPPDPARAEATRGKERLLLRAVPDRTTRVKVPVPVEPTGRDGSPGELTACFLETRSRTLAYVSETADPLHDRVAPHFVLKDLDGAQWLLMISLHTERHIAQIEEIKSSAGYPALATSA